MARLKALRAEAQGLPSLVVSSATAANAVMLGAGYFTPLTGFMNKADILEVAQKMQTTSGLFWPVPVANLTSDTHGVEVGSRVALRDPNVSGEPVLAIQTVSAAETLTDKDIDEICQSVYGTTDDAHPG
ncbi:MAG: sulfate adenylyltransferase, partial [Arenicellales bacterium]